MAVRNQTEESIKKKLFALCGSSQKFHDVYVWLPEGRCHIDLFVHTDEDIQSCTAQSLRDCVIEYLAASKMENRKITVEIDSNERVQRDFDGSYFKRFR